MTRILIFACLMALTILTGVPSGLAQSNATRARQARPTAEQEEQARIHFTRAQDLFDKGEIENQMEAVKELDDAEKLLGGPNPRTLYLKILAMDAVSQAFYYVRQKKEAFDQFFALVKKVPDYPKEKYDEIVKAQERFRGVEEGLRKLNQYELAMAPDFNGSVDCLKKESGLYYDAFFKDEIFKGITARQDALRNLQSAGMPDHWANGYVDPTKYKSASMRRMVEEGNKHFEYMSESTAEQNAMLKNIYRRSLETLENILQKNVVAMRYVFWQTRLANLDDSTAFANLSYCYAHGLGVAPDRKLAISYKLREMKLRQNFDYTELARLYENDPIDEHWTPDFQMALDLYKAAYENADGKTKGFIAWLIGIRYGTRFKNDRPQARLDAVKDWFERAFFHGNPKGMTELGSIYELDHPSGNTKEAIIKDNLTAVECYRKAAEQKEPMAVQHLARIYENGIPGVKKDKKLAKIYRGN